MLKLASVLLIALAVVYSSAALAQSASGRKSEAVKFSSLYTDLNRDCRNAFKSVGEGQDMPLNCKGYGGYKIYIWYSAMAAQLAVNSLDGKYTNFLAMQKLDYSDEKGRKIEWRLADGKPFAVILRISKYKDENAGALEYFSAQNKAGEFLIVKGLKGHEKIDFEVNVKDGNPNEKARKLADSNYAK